MFLRIILFVCLIGGSSQVARGDDEIDALNKSVVADYSTKDLPTALIAARAALTRARQKGIVDPSFAQALGNCAEIEHMSRNFTAADALFTESLKTYVALIPQYPSAKADVPALVNNWGRLKFDMGAYSFSEQLLQKALEFRNGVAPTDIYNQALTRNNLADTYEAEGKHDVALSTFNVTASQSDVGRPPVIYALRREGEILANAHRDLEAIQKYLAAIKLEEQPPRNSSAELADLYYAVGGLYDEVDQYENAITSFESAKMIYSASDERSSLEADLRVVADLTLDDRIAEAKQRFAIAESKAQKDFPADIQLQGDIAMRRCSIEGNGENNWTKAEGSCREALRLRRLGSPGSDLDVLIASENLGYVLNAEGKDAEGSQYLEFAINEGYRLKVFDQPWFAALLTNQANYFEDQGEYDKAAAVIDRAVTVYDQYDFGETRSYAQLLIYKAQFMAYQEDKKQAGPALITGAISILNRVGSLTDLASSYERLGDAYWSIGDLNKASQNLQIAVSFWDKSPSKDSRSEAITLTQLAQVKGLRGELDAEPLFVRALGILKSSGNDFSLARTEYQFAHFLSRQFRYKEAGQHYSVATRITIARYEEAWSEGAGDAMVRFTRETSGFDVFEAILNQTYVGTPTVQQTRALTGQLLELAQWASISQSALSVGALGARWSSPDTTVQELVRSRQDYSLKLKALRDQLRQMQLSGTVNDRYDALEKSIATLDGEARSLDARLSVLAPNVSTLAFPRPLAVPEIQEMLRADEALLYFQPTVPEGDHPEETLVWVVRKNDVSMTIIQPGQTVIDNAVDSLRCGLDATQWLTPAGSDRCANLTGGSWDGPGTGPLPYNLDKAYQLHEILLGRFKDLIQGKRLFIVAPGPLSTIPFDALLTSPPSEALPGTWDGYREAAWAVKTETISMLPSVSALRLLRMKNAEVTAPLLFAGFGDPLLGGHKGCPPPSEARCTAENASASTSTPVPRALGGEMPQMSLADPEARAAFVDSLCPVPETGVELSCIVGNTPLGGTLKVIGSSFTERRLRDLSDSGELGRYRIVDFATHGLLPVEAKSVGSWEPALVATPADGDDGLLTATEISRLKMNADWVFLAACNTASGSGGADGLAQAFFYAGTHAMLISNWEADANATADEFTSLMQNAPPGTALSDAHQAAELAVLSSKQREDYGHPALWAAFSVLGDGLAAH